MKVKKRVLALALIMLASMFGGCASGGDSSSGSQTGSETSEASQAQTTKNGHFYYDPPITLNLAIAIGPEVKFKEGQDINNNEYNDWMLDEFVLDVNYVWNTPTSDDAFYTKLMLSISAGEPLPDFFTIENGHAHELIDSGLLMPIDDLWEQYAGDVWKTAYEDVADCWLPYKRDGQTYAYPIADYLYEHEDVMWIRDDWLEAVGMEAPTNLDELRAVMEAFVNLDSSVTGNDEVYAVAAQLKGNYISWMGLNCIFGMFGMVPEMWLENADGEIVYSSTQPEVKESSSTPSLRWCCRVRSTSGRSSCSSTSSAASPRNWRNPRQWTAPGGCGYSGPSCCPFRRRCWPPSPSSQWWDTGTPGLTA